MLLCDPEGSRYVLRAAAVQAAVGCLHSRLLLYDEQQCAAAAAQLISESLPNLAVAHFQALLHDSAAVREPQIGGRARRKAAPAGHAADLPFRPAVLDALVAARMTVRPPRLLPQVEGCQEVCLPGIQAQHGSWSNMDSIARARAPLLRPMWHVRTGGRAGEGGTRARFSVLDGILFLAAGALTHLKWRHSLAPRSAGGHVADRRTSLPPSL